MQTSVLDNLPLVRRRNLAALIQIFEANYVRMIRLAPELDRLEGTVVSRVAGALDLYLTVLERHRYTTIVNLSYRFPGESDLLLEPNARIAMQHDTRTVELISHCRRSRPRDHRFWQPGHMPELDRRWEMNRFLQKWLGFCHRQGHLYLACAAQPVDELRSPDNPGGLDLSGFG